MVADDAQCLPSRRRHHLPAAQWLPDGYPLSRRSHGACPTLPPRWASEGEATPPPPRSGSTGLPARGAQRWALRLRGGLHGTLQRRAGLFPHDRAFWCHTHLRSGGRKLGEPLRLPRALYDDCRRSRSAVREEQILSPRHLPCDHRWRDCPRCGKCCSWLSACHRWRCATDRRHRLHRRLHHRACQDPQPPAPRCQDSHRGKPARW